VSAPRTIYLVVIATNTNPMLPNWEVGTPVTRVRSGMGWPTFADRDGLDAYVDHTEAELEIVSRGRCFEGITFEVKTYILTETVP
jgi:hypothetical protein